MELEKKPWSRRPEPCPTVKDCLASSPPREIDLPCVPPCSPCVLCGKRKALTTEDTGEHRGRQKPKAKSQKLRANSYFRKIRCASSPRGTVTCSPEARCLSAKASAATSSSPTMRM